MSEPAHMYLAKAEESVLGAESEFGYGRYNNAANRCYYACFQAAISALQHAGMAPGGRSREWGHAFVQAEFVGRLINRRRQYPPSLRQVLARNLTLRHTADYAPDQVTERQVSRALQRTRDFFAAVRDLLTFRARGSERDQVSNRKPPGLEDLEHLLTDCAGCPDNGNA